VLALPLFLLAIAAGHRAIAASLLMISVDGLKPEYVLDADAHGLKIPFLRSLMRDGAYARGVNGVWPTVTYPSHTTLLTGLSPAEHGIYNNLEFDPKNTSRMPGFGMRNKFARRRCGKLRMGPGCPPRASAGP
jgi:predicted AlkP superfamily pyrophosphatase or phosphodiesterase